MAFFLLEAARAISTRRLEIVATVKSDELSFVLWNKDKNNR